jgi:Outer membrane protein beta-barrel family/CarboxypepD_reg-like domain
MTKTLLTVILAVGFTVLYAQSPTRFQIQGTAADSSGRPLSSASVMLLQHKDSALVSYGRANDKGEFVLKNVKKGDYLIKISFVSFLPLEKNIVFGDNPTIDVGILKLKPIVKELFEVVVKAARAPLTIKGDTIEYNAASFKVPPGSTVEDLLKKLPGVLIDQDGNIKAQGQDVKKVLVDGKSFFGNDPKLATKNLAAEAITKVQVFNDKSEQSKATGIDDGKKEKAINLELKDEFKKGGFGKLTAAAGTDQRAQMKGNYNKFDKTNQFSVIGLANNVNQTGMSWDDYQDFRGSNSFSGWDDNADFGFNGGVRFFYSDDDEGALDIPTGGSRGRGFSNNIAGGVNYNHDTKTQKLSSSYYYNSSRQTVDAVRNQQRLLQNSIFKTNEESAQLNFNVNHRAALRYENKIDSSNTLVVVSNARFNQSNAGLVSFQKFFLKDTLNNTSKLNNNAATQKFEMANTAIYRLKFKEKGRNLALSASYNVTNTDGTATQESANEFFKAKTVNDILRVINQLQETESQRTVYKSSVSYTEPFLKKFYWETFYNFSLANSVINRNVMDKRTVEKRQIDSLSANFGNKTIYQRLGSSIRYSYKGTNVMVGMAGIRYALSGSISQGVWSSAKPIDINRVFVSWTPAASVNIDLKNNKYFYTDYSVSVQQPSVRDIQPIVNNSNPLYVTQGNPDLIPALSHNVYMGFNYFNPGSFLNFNTNLSYSYNINQIVYSQYVDTKTLITTTKPVNVTGGNGRSVWLNVGFPIVKTKATLNMSLNINDNKNLTPINNVANETNTTGYNLRTRLDLTPVDWFTAYLNTNFGISHTKYSINTTQNQQLHNNEHSLEMNIRLPKNVYLNANFNLKTYKNDRFGFDQRVPICNASVYKIMGKAKKSELRLSVYDALNRNLGISQFANQNFVSQERVQTLARYFMLSYTYNMRGVNINIKKRNNFY